MTDQIRFDTEQKRDGSTYEVATLWIATVPFRAALDPYTERMTRRIAAEAGLEILDYRRASAAPTN